MLKPTKIAKNLAKHHLFNDIYITFKQISINWQTLSAQFVFRDILFLRHASPNFVKILKW